MGLSKISSQNMVVSHLGKVSTECANYENLSFQEIVFALELTPRARLNFVKKSSIGRISYMIDYESKRARKAEFQGLYNPFNIIHGSNRLLDNANNVVETAGQTMSEIKEKTALMVDNLTSIISEKINASFDCLSLLTKTIKVLVNLALARTDMWVYSLIFNIGVEFGSEIANMIHQVFEVKPQQSVAYDANTRKVTLQSGMDLSVLGMLAEFTSNKISELSPAVIGSVLATSLVASMGLKSYLSPRDTLKHFSDLCKDFNGIANFAKVAVPLFGMIGTYVYSSATNRLPNSEELDSFLDGYKTWAEEVQAICLQDSPIAVRLEKDKALYFKIHQLYKKGVEYSLQIGSTKIAGAVSMHYLKIFKLIEGALKECDTTGVFGNRPRMKPAIIHLFGESGVGKSGMSWPLSCDLNAAFCSTVEEAKEFSKEIYFRSTEQEFWDGYAGQNIVVYDDFGQRGDSQAAPNEEFMEIIRVGNLAPYPLHMASLEEKRRTKFCSKAVILTSNILNLQVNSLTFPDAFRRRIDVCGKVTLKEEFTKEGSSLKTGETVKRLDIMKCNGPCDTRPYLVQLYNPETQEPIVNSEDGSILTLDYESFVSRCLKVTKAAHANSQVMNNILEDRIDERRFTALKAQLQTGDELDFANEPVVETPQAQTRWSRLFSEYKSKLSDFMTSMTLMKSALTIIALLMGGIGIWSYFKTGTNVHHQKGSSQTQRTCSNNTNCCVANTEATCSNDSQTKNKKQIKTEATCSNDSQTKNKKLIKTEAVSSGDLFTKKKQTIVTECNTGDVITEAFGSGDSRTKNKKVARTEALPPNPNAHTITVQAPTSEKNIAVQTIVPCQLQAWKDATAQDLITHRILANMYKIVRVRGDDETTIVNGLFVRDRIMLVPKHTFLSFGEGDEIRIENCFGVQFRFPFSVLKRRDIAASNGGDKDASLVEFPRQVNAHSDLVKHFQTMPELSLKRATVCLPTLRCVRGVNMVSILGNTQATCSHLNLDIDGSILRIRDCIAYNLNTIGGDCGGPIIVNENSVLRKIAGIHIAAAPGGEEAYGQSVTQMDLARTLVLFGKEPVITDFDALENFSIMPAELQMNKDYDSAQLREILRLPAENFAFVGGCSRVPFAPNATDIRKSLIHGMVHEPTTKPSVLYSNKVNVMEKNIAKCSLNTPYIPEMEVETAVAEVKSQLLSGSLKPELKRVLTFEEAVAGNDTSEYISGLNRASSAGYPWVLDRKPGTHGKTGWFGTDEYVFDGEVRQSVEDRIELAKNGVRKNVTWSATLKDERRTIEKVEACKTRVFATGPMDYTIAVRMYFLGFVAHVMENRIDNEQSLGTNPLGYDWTKTAKKLQKFGKKVFAGDFSSFDGTLNSCILSRFTDVVNAFYNDGPENARIREVLLMDVYNSTWLCNGTYIGLNHSQPSGNPLTTVLNSFYNSVSMRIAYYRCAKEAGVKAPKFADVVSMVSYGDDNVINFQDSIADWFNQLTVTKAYDSFGMIYTDEAKTGELVAYRTLEEVAYLKRSFRNTHGIYRAPMALATLYETPNWIRQSPDSLAATQMNVEDVIMELAQHPKEIFIAESQALLNAFYETTGIYPEVCTYETYNERWNTEMGLLA